MHIALHGDRRCSVPEDLGQRFQLEAGLDGPAKRYAERVGMNALQSRRQYSA